MVSLIIIYLVILLIANNQSAVAQQSSDRTADCSKQSFFMQWVQVSILSDSVYENQRNVEVLLGERVFTECVLRWVFGMVSRRYSEPSRLHILVRNGIDVAGALKQPWAEYSRDERGEAFRYKPNPSYKGVKITVTKGSDPFERQKIL